MRTLAIGDIHGCYTALTTLADQVGFADGDQVILLGDYIDRGPDSGRVLDWILTLSDQLPVTAVRGNHEVMVLTSRNDSEFYRAWLSFGGEETLASYGVDDFHGPWRGEIPDAHWQFLQSTKPYYETESHIFVHAGAYPDYSMDEQSEYMLYWSSFNFIKPHRSGKEIICGHSSQKSGRIATADHAICIDTWVYGGGWLTCLDVASKQYWQANQRGEYRSGQI